MKNKLISALWWTNYTFFNDCKSVLTCLVIGYNYKSYNIHLWVSQLTQIIIINQLFRCVSFSDCFIGRICSSERISQEKQNKHKEKAENETTDQYVFFLATNHHFVTFSGSFFDPSGPDQPQTNDSEMWV